jgi:2-dehydropantoate 2-reductase
VVRHAGIEPTIAFNELSNRSSPRVEQLKAAFDHAGVKADIPADIHAAMWEKFVFIAAISGVGAAVGAPAGILRSVPETRQMLIQAMEETVAVAQAKGVNLSHDLAERIMANIDGMAPGVTASMQRDILEGRPSELEYQNGSIVRMGKQTGVPTPVHECLYSILLPKELKARNKIEF